MSSFRQAVADVVDKVEGGLGAVIMGYDGIAIEEYVIDQEICDVQLLAIEYVTLLKEVRKTIDILQTGAVDEMTVATQKVTVIVRIINDDFFIVLAIRPDGNCGKARYLLRRAAPLLREELG